MDKSPIQKGEGSCRTCRFYESYGDRVQGECGTCHRHAPQPVVLKEPEDHELYQNYQPVWPTVDFNDWCGEWQWDDEVNEFIGKK